MTGEIISNTIKYLTQKSGKMAIFCGAGISIRSGGPDSEMFKTYLIESTNMTKTDIKKILKYEQPLELFLENLFSELPKWTFGNLFSAFSEIPPTMDHEIIASLCKIGVISTIVTTNFDNALEQALSRARMKEGQDFLVFRDQEDFKNLKNKLNLNTLLILKLHGSSDRVKSIRAFLSSLSNPNNTNMLDEVISSLFNSHRFELMLFIGYSFSDIFDVNHGFSISNTQNKELIVIRHSLGKTHTTHDLKRIMALEKFEGKTIYTDSDAFMLSVLKGFDLELKYGGILYSPMFKYAIADLFAQLESKNKLLPSLMAANMMRGSGYYREEAKYLQKALNLGTKEDREELTRLIYKKIRICYNKLGLVSKEIEWLDKELHLTAKSGDRSAALEMAFDMARLYKIEGHPEEFSDLVEKILTRYKLTLSSSTKRGIKAFIERESNYAGTIRELVKDLESEENEGNLPKQMSTLIELSTVYQFIGKFKESLESCDRAFSLATALKDNYSSALILSEIGKNLLLSDMPQNALPFYERSLETAQTLGNNSFESYILSQVGQCYAMLNAPHKAISILNRSIELSTNIKAYPESSRALDTLGTVYESIGNEEKAEECLKRGLDLARKTNYTPEISRGMYNLGKLYLRRHEFEKAIELLEKSLEIAKRSEDAFRIVGISDLLASLYLELNDAHKTIDLLKGLCKYYVQRKDGDGLAVSYLKLSDTYLIQKDLDSSEIYYLKALYYAERSEFVELKETVHEYIPHFWGDNYA